MKQNKDIEIKRAEENDGSVLAPMIAGFRVYLKSLHNIEAQPDEEAALEEFREYIEKDMPVYIALFSAVPAGYMILRSSGGAVWAESLFVQPQHRRQGAASELFRLAEEYALSEGSQCVFNWVHPNNDMIIGFLKSRGYNTLNLIEIRKDEENPKQEIIKAGIHTYKY